MGPSRHARSRPGPFTPSILYLFLRAQRETPTPPEALLSSVVAWAFLGFAKAVMLPGPPSARLHPGAGTTAAPPTPTDQSLPETRAALICTFLPLQPESKSSSRTQQVLNKR